MPKRSNEFQAITYMAKRCLSNDAVVRESHELVDRHTGRFCEVDVTVSDRIAGHDVILGFECIDRSRPATVEWVDQMAGKHASLPTSELILVSRSGFTRGARMKADALGIVTVSFDQEPQEIEQRLRDRLQTGDRMIRVGMRSSLFSVEVETEDGLTASTDAARETGIYLGNATRVGDLGLLVDSYLASSRIAGQLIDAQLQDNVKHNHATLWVEPGIEADGATLPVFIKDDAADVLLRVRQLTIGIDYEREDNPIEVQHAKLGEVGVAVGRSRILDRDCLTVATMDAGGQPRLAVRAGHEEGTASFIDDETSRPD